MDLTEIGFLVAISAISLASVCAAAFGALCVLKKNKPLGIALLLLVLIVAFGLTLEIIGS